MENSSAKNIIRAFVSFFKIVVFDRVFSFFVVTFLLKKKKADNVLIVCGGGVGDMVVATAVLKQYKEYYKGRKIYLLCNNQNHPNEILDHSLFERSIEIIFGDFKRHPLYAINIARQLNDIGFKTAIFNVTTGLARLSPLFYLTGAEEIYGYEGEAYYRDITLSQDLNIWVENKMIFPLIKGRFTNMISSIPEERENNVLVSTLKHQKKLLEGITHRTFGNLSTNIPSADPNNISPEVKEAAKHPFFLVAPGAGAAYRRWPVERFADVCKDVTDNNPNFVPVIVGLEKEKDISDSLAAKLPGSINLSGKTTINDLKYLIKESLFLFCNDTGFVHMAIALQKPSVAVVGGNVGYITHYGYKKINRWVCDRNAVCLFDNWRCLRSSVGAVAPCIDSISASEVSEEVKSLLNYLKKSDSHDIMEFSFWGI
jgi:ADP-heptose:LPS heptosyltransferase